MATWLIVGADRGIGEAMCVELLERGEDVIAVCQHRSESLKERGARVERNVDVRFARTVADMAARLDGVTIDVLVNVAGVGEGRPLGKLDFDQMRHVMDVNAIGPLRVIDALHHRVADGGKVAIVTSRMGSIGDNGSGGSYAYRMSKAAANMAGVSLARDLEPRGIAVALLHPGTVRTAMTGMGRGGGPAFVDADFAAKGLIARMDELSLATTGRFWHAQGEELPF